MLLLVSDVGSTLAGGWLFDDLAVSRFSAQATSIGEIASYWESECLVASSQVILGVNELLIGLNQVKPFGRSRLITDLHYALSDKPGTMTIEMRKWNDIGTISTLLHTATLVAGQTRAEYSGLNLSMGHKERVFFNVTAKSADGATGLQAEIFGVII